MKLSRIMLTAIAGLSLAGCAQSRVQTAAIAAPAPVVVKVSHNTAGKVTRTPVHDLVTKVAERKQVPIALAHAIVRQESNYNPSAVGRGGPLGLTQIKCQTARGLGFKGDCSQLKDAETNLVWGLEHLQRAIRRGGASCKGVALHQMGLYATPRCTAYGSEVMTIAANFTRTGVASK